MRRKPDKGNHTVSSYAGQKGRSTPAASVASKPKVLRELSPAESERVAVNRAFVLDHMPDMARFIKDLYAEEMIDGWRGIVRCELLDRP